MPIGHCMSFNQSVLLAMDLVGGTLRDFRSDFRPGLEWLQDLLSIMKRNRTGIKVVTLSFPRGF